MAFQPDAFQNDAFQTGSISASFTADAVLLGTISASFTANSIIRVTQTASFTADAEIAAASAASFTADAIILANPSASFTADAVITTGTVVTSFTADAFIRPYFTADAIIKRAQAASFTANAIKSVTQSRSLTADAFLVGFVFQKHDRTDAHEGTDYDSDHFITWSFDRYMRGDNLRDVLIDMDTRLTARENAMTSNLLRFTANAVVKATMAASFTADAEIV